MNNAAVAVVIATTLFISPPAGARDRLGAGMVLTPATAGLIASARGCRADCGGALYFGYSAAIFGYGYRATYYGNGFAYQPAYDPGHAYYAGPRFRGCCRW